MQTCQHRTDPLHKLEGYLQALCVCGQFLWIHMNFLRPLIITPRCIKHILLAICILTRCTIASKFDSSCRIHRKKVIFVHSCSKELLSDRGTHFSGQIVKGLLKLLDTKHLITSSYHAACDGVSERALNTFTMISQYTITNHEIGT